MRDDTPDPDLAVTSLYVSDAILDAVEVFGTNHARWQRRDSDRADAGARRAASRAVDAIDQLLAELHRTRSQLVGEVRRADDAANAHADALLARYRDGGQ